ncbi:MAG TPA: lipoyl(octanoyl) transferase LipB [candidate division Zixibacteria bacterium]|nr:lipoyl(octanoyl) transferase LipB [candidate division Zixibacteria bacterium]MDD4918548.1 lipoyl(octanoyl) transferase LipB [candidate division Zixibacteria bacterium]MDM7971941.1 lipoyl(octanoyl) transferase LipB [candidate division Zixibacteria bacterium]HOD65608.1 lipoyl(octanoyl) transferase LipB [candidate division Zixibacteria bacterium]HOZ07071.1 lipoyl(octanoyl) transferase LipB [candidate division Zixibacteria bacterium]
MSVYTPRPYGWVLEVGRVEYERALAWQRGLVKMRREGMARDTIMFVEHPAVCTVGRDGHEEHYRNISSAPVFVERGGDVTWHGPGQLVVYFIFNLARRGRDLHAFMTAIQQGIVDALAEWEIAARLGEEYTGVWVGPKKIASIGVAVKKWITFHGAAINLNTDLREFAQMEPCGLSADLMTSAAEQLGRPVDMQAFAQALLRGYAERFHTQFDPVALEAIAEDLESQSGGYTI